MNSLPPHLRHARAALTALGLAAPTACFLLAPHGAALGLGLGGYTLVGLLAIAIREYSWRGPRRRRPSGARAGRQANSSPPARERTHPDFGDCLRKQTHAQ